MPSLTTTSVAVAQMVRNSKMASKAEKDALVQAVKTLKRQKAHLNIRHDCYKHTVKIQNAGDVVYVHGTMFHQTANL